ETQRLASTWVQPGSEVSRAFAERFNTPLTREYSLLDLLRRPEVDYRTLTELTGSVDIPADAAEQVEIQTQYAGHIERQQDESARLRQHEETRLPEGLDYAAHNGLSTEHSRERASTRRQ